MYNSTLYHLHWCFSKNSPFENFKKSTVCNINSKQFSKQISRLKSIMQFFFSELHTKNYRFQPCAFLKLRKISEITSAVEILFYWTDDRRFALQNTCSKQFCGKLPGRSASVLKKDSNSDVTKSCWKVLKKLKQLTKIRIYSIKLFIPILRLPNGRSFTLMKSCYSKRHIKIHGPRPSRAPYFFA